MHSSRMRTVCSLTVSGGLVPTSLDADTPLDADPEDADLPLPCGQKE